MSAFPQDFILDHAPTGSELALLVRIVGGLAPLAKTIQSAVVNLSGSGDFVIVDDVPARRIKVVSYMIQAGESELSASVLSLMDSTSSVLAGPFFLGDREGISLVVPIPSFLFGTSAGNPLVARLSGSREIGGFVTYFSDDSS
jgi:hypothetical protein